MADDAARQRFVLPPYVDSVDWRSASPPVPSLSDEAACEAYMEWHRRWSAGFDRDVALFWAKWCPSTLVDQLQQAAFHDGNQQYYAQHQCDQHDGNQQSEHQCDQHDGNQQHYAQHQYDQHDGNQQSEHQCDQHDGNQQHYAQHHQRDQQHQSAPPEQPMWVPPQPMWVPPAPKGPPKSFAPPTPTPAQTELTAEQIKQLDEVISAKIDASPAHQELTAEQIRELDEVISAKIDACMTEPAYSSDEPPAAYTSTAESSSAPAPTPARPQAPAPTGSSSSTGQHGRTPASSSTDQPSAPPAKEVTGNFRRGSGVLRASGRWGARGGTGNPNVQWHTALAQATREGWAREFRSTYPKPKKEPTTG